MSCSCKQVVGKLIYLGAVSSPTLNLFALRALLSPLFKFFYILYLYLVMGYITSYNSKVLIVYQKSIGMFVLSKRLIIFNFLYIYIMLTISTKEENL